VSRFFWRFDSKFEDLKGIEELGLRLKSRRDNPLSFPSLRRELYDKVELESKFKFDICKLEPHLRIARLQGLL